MASQDISAGVKSVVIECSNTVSVITLDPLAGYVVQYNSGSLPVFFNLNNNNSPATTLAGIDGAVDSGYMVNDIIGYNRPIGPGVTTLRLLLSAAGPAYVTIYRVLSPSQNKYGV